MWATVRERHPDVNIVLLPGQGDATEPDPATPVSRDEASEAAHSLVRRVTLIAELLGVANDPVAGWERIPGLRYQPTARLHGSASAETPTDAQVIQHRLTQLGWVATVRPESAVVWVDGETGNDFVRVTIVDGIVGVRATGAAMSLDPADVDELLGGN